MAYIGASNIKNSTPYSIDHINNIQGVRPFKMTVDKNITMTALEFLNMLQNPKGVMFTITDNVTITFPSTDAALILFENVLGREITHGDIFSVPMGITNPDLELIFDGGEAGDEIFTNGFMFVNNYITGVANCQLTMKFIVNLEDDQIDVYMPGYNPNVLA